jgi:probable rRNA maturation factor
VIGEVVVQRAIDQPTLEWLPDDTEIERWVHVALSGKYDCAQLTVRIVGHEESQRLNETYRHNTGPTNVLSFPFERPEMLQPPLLGDVVICAPLVVTEADNQGKKIIAHWAHLVIHGVLHLIGYDHENADEANIMEALERKIMRELDYPDPYAENEATVDSIKKRK